MIHIKLLPNSLNRSASSACDVVTSSLCLLYMICLLATDVVLSDTSRGLQHNPSLSHNTSSFQSTPEQSNKSNSSVPTSEPEVGAWINRGLAYPYCELTSQKDRCSNSILNQPSVDKADLWKPECDLLSSRITCVIRKINCPDTTINSFQIYDMPCQASCLAAVAVCGARYFGSPGQHVGGWYEFGQLAGRSPREPARRSPKPNTLWSWNSQAYENDWRRPRYQQNQRKVPPSYYDWSTSRRTNRAVQTWLNPALIDTKTSANISRIPRSLEEKTERLPTWMEPVARDCFYLPTGACDNWSDYLISVHRLENLHIEKQLKTNTGCPENLDNICESMFPKKFTRGNWQKGKFTIAVVIRVAQTMWWFGKDNMFQPFFRFHVQQTLVSDITPYNEKMILTYSWPLKCACPNEVTVGQRYILLTHSLKTRQTFNLTESSVFLSRVKRYTRKITCWKGACPPRRDRFPRYPMGGQWHWQQPHSPFSLRRQQRLSYNLSRPHKDMDLK